MRWPKLRRHPPCLGLDLGTTAIKAAVCRGRQWLTASVPAPPNGFTDHQVMTAAIAEAVSRTGWRGRRAVTAVTGDRVVARYLRLPRMTAAELKRGMAYEIENYLPAGTQDMVVDWTIMDNSGDTDAKQMQVILAAAPREQVTRLYEVCRDAGLELAAIDLVPLALCRALVGAAAAAAILLDIGGRWSNLVLAREGRPLFSRVIAMGGGELSSAAITGSSRTAELALEIRRSLDFYRSQFGTTFNPQQLILTGGGAQLDGLAGYCQEEMGIPVIEGLPGTVMATPDAYARSRTSGELMDPALAVAIGLALWGTKR